jgi:hypothetical protein
VGRELSYRVLVGNIPLRRPRMGELGLDKSCLGYGQGAGSCEQGYELSDSIKCREFLDLVKDSYLPTKFFILWS